MSRFIDNGNDTITDIKTGLTWFKKDSRQIMGKWIHLEKAIKFAAEKNTENSGVLTTGGCQNWKILKPFLTKVSASEILEILKFIFPRSSNPNAQIALGRTQSMATAPCYSAWSKAVPAGSINLGKAPLPSGWYVAPAIKTALDLSFGATKRVHKNPDCRDRQKHGKHAFEILIGHVLQ